MFDFLKSAVKNLFESFSTKLAGLFGRNKLEQADLEELERILLSADVGFSMTNGIITRLTQAFQSGNLQAGSDLKKALEAELTNRCLTTPALTAQVIMLVGINGSGKTTFAAKLAHYYSHLDKKVVLVAADTFRAAAVEQLESWGQRLNIPVIKGQDGQDPASVVFAGCQQYKDQQADILIIDTAGRLQTKVNLMNELTKLARVVEKQLPDKQRATLLTIDTMLGQNSLDQATLFHEATKLDGLVLTKLDGTGKAGIVLHIMDSLKIPVQFISHGEQPEAMERFDAQAFIKRLLAE